MGTPQPLIQDAISKDGNGFFKADDAELGERVQQMDEGAKALASEGGLHFYSTNVLQHPQIRSIIGTSFKQSSPGVYRSFGPTPIICSFDSNQESDLEILIVMLWNKGSKVTFWPRSHCEWLEPTEASNSLLHVAKILQLFCTFLTSIGRQPTQEIKQRLSLIPSVRPVDRRPLGKNTGCASQRPAIDEENLCCRVSVEFLTSQWDSAAPFQAQLK